jgi:arylsulfatase A-like enzyme
LEKTVLLLGRLWRNGGVLGAATSALLLWSSACFPGDKKQPNVVLVVIDTLRADHLGFLGYQRETAPYLASLAASSAVFENAFSASTWTAPATATIMTGHYPTEHGVVENFFAHRERAKQIEMTGGAHIPLNRLPRSLPTLAERMRDAGYATYGLASNINIGRDIGFDRGFLHFDALVDEDASVLAARVADWSEEMLGAGDPYFLYLHFNDVHSPYHARPPWYIHAPSFREQQISAYDSEISYLDLELRRIGQLLAWDDRTIIVVASDHGEEFGEHGRTGHNFSLHDELMHTLLLIHGEGVRPGRVAANVSTVDIVPTILGLVGVDADADLAGHSLAAAAVAEGWTGDVAFAHRLERDRSHERHLWAVVDGPWKAIAGGAELELYNLEESRAELENLATEKPATAVALEERLRGFQRGAFEVENERIEVPLDQEALDRLRTLGYAD